MKIDQTPCPRNREVSDPVVIAFARRGEDYCDGECGMEPMSLAACGLALALIAAADALDDSAPERVGELENWTNAST